MQERELDPVIEAYKKDIDRTLFRENLKLSVEERFRKTMALANFADEFRRAGREARSRHSHHSVQRRLASLIAIDKT